jgi:single-stranded-DNA-specific exonuclease
VEARNRIIHAVNNSEKISIFSDPDNDGICATAIMYNYLRNFTENITYFYNQRSASHGINTSMHLVPEDTELLIIVDSSSNDTEECKILKLNGINTVVLDHHPIEQENPYCILVNPQQNGCDYPNKNISGSVVSLKMCKALDEQLGTEYSSNFYDLAAIGLLGDQMNMLECENRFIVQEGLGNITTKGIKALLSALGLDKDNLSSTNILYSISPCLNAACRLDQIEIALSLLTEENPKIYKQLAHDIVQLNEKRKIEQSKYYKLLIDSINSSDKCSIVIENSIGAGYRGLLAGDFSNEFKRSVMILSEDEDDTYYGSYRSYNGYDLKSILNSIPEVLMTAGHPPAGGIRFKRSDLDKVQSYLNEHLPSLDRENHLEYVLEFDLEEVNEQLIKDIESFYRLNGNGFDVGLFRIANCFVLDKKILGKEKNTVKVDICSAKLASKYKNWGYDSLEPTHCLMKFRTNPDYFKDRYLYKQIDVVGSLNLNTWKNPNTGKTKTTKQIFIEDFGLVY